MRMSSSVGRVGKVGVQVSTDIRVSLRRVVNKSQCTCWESDNDKVSSRTVSRDLRLVTTGTSMRITG